MKSIPIWNHGDTTGTGWSSGAATVILRLFRWHTSQFAKAAYFDKLASNLSSQKDFWSAYHKLAPRKDRIPVDLKLTSRTASTSTQKANLLNKFFSSCFSTSPNPPVLDSPTESTPCLSNISCTQEEVQKLLASQKLNTASGPDGISSHMLYTWDS